MPVILAYLTTRRLTPLSDNPFPLLLRNRNLSLLLSAILSTMYDLMASIAFDPTGTILSFLPFPFTFKKPSFVLMSSMLRLDISLTLKPLEQRSSRIALSLAGRKPVPSGLSTRAKASSTERNLGRSFGSFGLETSFAGFDFLYPSRYKNLKNDLILASLLLTEVLF